MAASSVARFSAFCKVVDRRFAVDRFVVYSRPRVASAAAKLTNLIDASNLRIQLEVQKTRKKRGFSDPTV